MWTYIDVFCGITNVTSFILLMGIDKEDVLDTSKSSPKRLYNTYMCLNVFASWSRVAGLCFVIEKYAKLLITVQKMTGSAKTFFFILFLYFAIMGVVAQCLFQEYSITYSTFSNTIRTMFDVMMGAYTYDIGRKKFERPHEFYMYFHVYIANIFMLNYLVAILATVYEEMLEEGEFIFMCKKYFYIERYMVAFQDDGGYTELIVHAPPVNFFLVFLMPAIFSKERMRKWAHNFSIMNFWAENFFFILWMFIKELMLVPFNFLRTAWSILKLVDIHDFYLFFFWILYGVPYLLFYGLCSDMYYHI